MRLSWLTSGAVLRWGRGQLPPNLSHAPQIFAYRGSQYEVVKPANSYLGGASFWRVGVVDLVVMACVLRATIKKGCCLPPTPKYFLLEPPLAYLLIVSV